MAWWGGGFTTSPAEKRALRPHTDLQPTLTPTTDTPDSAHAAHDGAAEAQPAPQDTAHVLGLIGGYQISQAVYAAAALKLADLIAAGVDTSESLAAGAGAVPDRRERTQQEFSDLLDTAGFKIARVVETPAPTSLIEAHPVRAVRPPAPALPVWRRKLPWNRRPAAAS